MSEENEGPKYSIKLKSEEYDTLFDVMTWVFDQALDAVEEASQKEAYVDLHEHVRWLVKVRALQQCVNDPDIVVRGREY